MDSVEKDLEAFLKEAQAQAAARKHKPGQPAPQATRLAWTDPRNWAFRCQTQLVHVSEERLWTLLGIFDTFVHPTGARRFVAAQLNAAMKPVIEYVKGAHWITDYRKKDLLRQQPDQTVTVIEDLVLDCGVSAGTVGVTCKILGGGVAGVSLDADTVFESFTPRTVLALPAGMDVLEGLTRDTKERLWAEVKKQLGMKDEEDEVRG